MTLPAPTAAAPAASVTPPASATPPVATSPGTAPSTPPGKPPADPKSEGRGKRIWNLLEEAANEEPGKKKEPKTPAPEPVKPVAADPNTPAAPAAAGAPTDKPIKATKRPAISKRPEPTPAAAAPVATPTPPVSGPAADDFEAGLIDEEKQLLTDAAEAEKHLPARKGLKEQVKKYIKEHNDYLEKHPNIDEDPEEEAAYQKWRQAHAPRLTEAEQRTVSEKRIVSQVSQPFEERTRQLEHEIFVRDEEPKIATAAQKTLAPVSSSAIPKEILEHAEKYGLESAKKHFADELDVHHKLMDVVSGDYQELVRLGTRNPKTNEPLSRPVMTSAENPEKFVQHQRLETIVRDVCNDFKNNSPERDLLRDGKWFVTKDEWREGYNDPKKYWTFSLKEIADRSLATVPKALGILLERRRQEMTNRGYVRAPFAPPAAAASPAPEPSRSAPGPAPSPVPAPSNGTPPPTTRGGKLASLLSSG